MHDQLDVDALAAEIADKNFSDDRLTKRLGTIVRAVGRDPTASFPSVFTSAELEGAYRFFSNPLVTLGSLLQPHLDATAARATDQCVRVVHDQTEFSYGGDPTRRALGNRGYQGFCGHFSLVVSANDARAPLGLAAVHTWVRGETSDTEQSYWLKQIEASAAQLGPNVSAIHIADRGSDGYDMYRALLSSGHRFVIRSGNRFTQDAPDGMRAKLRDVLATVNFESERSATINRRRRHPCPRLRVIHPPRERRDVVLHVAAAAVGVRSTLYQRKKRPHPIDEIMITMNAVRIWEPSPPEGDEPIEWFLLTSEPIGTPEEVLAIVDHYRARWTVEEYFKALKTGCAFERRQLHDYEALVNALGVFAPLAFHILHLRTLARANPDAPAATVIDADQLAVLRKLGRRPLPEIPSARDALLAIAALGGHIKYAPDPGWLTIARGFEKLELLVKGWRAAKLQPACDQR